MFKSCRISVSEYGSKFYIRYVHRLCVNVVCLFPLLPPTLLSSWSSSEEKNRLQTFQWKYTSGISIHVQHNQNVIQYNWKMNKIYEKKKKVLESIIYLRLWHLKGVTTTAATSPIYLFFSYTQHRVKIILKRGWRLWVERFVCIGFILFATWFFLKRWGVCSGKQKLCTLFFS